MVSAAVDLVADCIENPHNVRALEAAARMFGVGCVFREPRMDAEAVTRNYDLIVGLENVPHAESIYRFRVPRGVQRIALVCGNERRGIRADLLRRCGRFVQIPMANPKVNTLNVAAATAVALHYICAGDNNEQRRWLKRPAVLFRSPKNAAEFGSALRSASAFGWKEVYVDDRNAIWFGAQRADKADARAAARRVKNDIRVLPARLLSDSMNIVMIDDIDEYLRLHASIVLSQVARRL